MQYLQIALLTLGLCHCAPQQAPAIPGLPFQLPQLPQLPSGLPTIEESSNVVASGSRLLAGFVR